MTGGKILKGFSVLAPMKDTSASADTSDSASADTRSTRSTPKSRRGTGNRWNLLNLFLDDTLRGLSRADLAVWLLLFRDSKDGKARTAQSYIAKRAGICRRSVATSVGKLERAGLLEVVHQGGLNCGLSIYRVKATGKPS